MGFGINLTVQVGLKYHGGIYQNDIITWLALHFQSVKSVAEKFLEFLEKASISSKPLALACKGSHYRKSCVMSLAVKSKNSSPYFVFFLLSN